MRYLKTYKIFESTNLSDLEELLSDVLLEVKDLGFSYDIDLLRNNMYGDPLSGFIKIKCVDYLSDHALGTYVNVRDITINSLDDIKDVILRINYIIPIFHIRFHLRATQSTDKRYQEENSLKYRVSSFIDRELNNDDDDDNIENLFSDEKLYNDINEYGLYEMSIHIKRVEISKYK